MGTPAGRVPAMPPGRTDALEPRIDEVPALGQHTDAILREAGWDDARIAAMRAEQVV